ncbi:MAG: phosphomethylpyrimidine kinase [Methanoregula sp.]|nr:phosphomethylpyrimidine kinase [Methanoregula sp.]
MNSPAQERALVLEGLTRAVNSLLQSIDARILPPGGANIGYAITGARDKNGVAAVPGGIVKTDDGIRASGSCAFGGNETIARIVLTAMKFDPVMRSAATIRYSKKIIPVLESMFLECKVFSRRNAPEGLSTMDWGIASCCRDGVPDVIYADDSNEDAAFICIFGEEPVDVTNNIIMLSNRIIHIEL